MAARRTGDGTRARGYRGGGTRGGAPTTRTIYIRGIAPFVNERRIATPAGALLTKHENLDARFTSSAWGTFNGNSYAG